MSLERTLSRLAERHVERGPVLALGWGHKWTGGRRTQEPAIVFYVRRKASREALGRDCAPAWVYDRRADGSCDRSRRYRTDVQPVGTPSAVESGEPLRRRPGRFGSATLVFDVRRPGGRRRCYAVGASHVMADVFAARTPGTELELRGHAGRVAHGTTRAHVAARRGRLPFDVALARLEGGTRGLALRSVPRSEQRLTRLPRAPREGSRLRVVGARTPGVGRGLVRARLATPLPVRFRRGRRRETLLVENLYELTGFVPREGDSGGLLYSGSNAVGLVVARHAEGLFFQPLRRGLAYLLERTSEDVRLSDVFPRRSS